MVENKPKAVVLSVKSYGRELLIVGNKTDTEESLHHYARLTEDYLKQLTIDSGKTPQHYKIMAKCKLGTANAR